MWLRRSASCALTESISAFDASSSPRSSRFAEDGKIQRPHGNEIAVRARAVHGAGAVVAVKAERGQPLAAIHRVHRLVLHRLVLQVLVVLAALVRQRAHLFRRLLGQVAVRRRIGQRNLLSRDRCRSRASAESNPSPAGSGPRSAPAAAPQAAPARATRPDWPRSPPRAPHARDRAAPAPAPPAPSRSPLRSASAMARRYAVATCCTTSPRADILLKYADRSAAPAAFQPAITGPENRIWLKWICPSVRSSRVMSREPRRHLAARKQRRELGNRRWARIRAPPGRACSSRCRR